MPLLLQALGLQPKRQLGIIQTLGLQIRASWEKPLGQLFVYACCLSRLTGIHFAKIKLAWFDEKDYFETDTMDVYKNVMKSFTK